MRISYIQTTLQWEQPEANLQMLTSKIGSLAGNTDLIVLPEMFTTGFSMNATHLAERPDGTAFHWMKSMAYTSGAAITGSFICHENGCYYNRLLWVQPDGTTFKYDKKHLFTLAGEHKVFTPGNEPIIINWKGWRIKPLICYDLRFPVWARQPRNEAPYDLLLYVANWPQPRSHHWRSLLMARAIENQSYVVGVNITGNDGNGLAYSGDSTIIDYSGQVLAASAYSEQVVTLELSAEQIHSYRKQFAFLNDADDYKV